MGCVAAGCMKERTYTFPHRTKIILFTKLPGPSFSTACEHDLPKRPATVV